MKKSILSLLAVIAVIGTFFSFTKRPNQSSTQYNALSIKSDSIAMIQGYMTGQQLAQQFVIMAMQDMPVNSAEFLKGFKKGIADTTKFSYNAGQLQGVQTAMEFMKDGLDIKLFTEYLEAGLNGETTKMTMDQEAAYNYVQSYYDQKQEIEKKKKPSSTKRSNQRSTRHNALSAKSDSVAMIQGYLAGQQFAQQLVKMAEEGMSVNSAEFLKGFKIGVADTSKFSYYAGQIQGVQAAMSLAPEGLDTKLFTEYLEAGLKGDTTKMTMDQEAAYNYIQNYYQKKQETENREKYGKNIEAGQKAIAEFAKQAGVITTKSGIAYRYVTRGTGKSPIDSDKVKVTYRGTFTDGTEFDKSEEPIEFDINQVIPGWTELLKLMRVGDHVIAYIPYNLAYGANGGSSIEPFSTLVFEIELLEVIKGQPIPLATPTEK